MKKILMIIAAATMWTSCAAQTGGQYKEISLPAPDGKDVKLSQVVADNKYTLLDFWASWCGPCMREMPYLTKAYGQFKDKGFEIYAVSYDQDAIAWQSAIKKNNMNWVHVSALKGWGCPTKELYGVNSIPRNFLIDAKGNIVAENLRGAALAEKLAELLK